MKTRIQLIILCCLVAFRSLAQVKPPVSPWPATTALTHPWTRWWWMGSAVDENNLKQLLYTYKAAGIGGVEITPIYGAIGFENRYINFLSPDWMKMLRFTTSTAKGLGMGVDMNTGTGWPFGGPQITTADAAGKLIVQTYELTAGESLSKPIVADDKRQSKAILQSLIAYNDLGKPLDITAHVDASGKLNYEPEGHVKLYAVFAGKTLQKVKRAAPGGEGWVMDHFSRNAVDTYLQRFSKAFAGNNNGVNAFFNDSYEVFNSDWSAGLFAQFNKDHHYQLEMHIRDLMREDDNDTVARVKSDYMETVSNMLLHNFTQNWTEWAHGLKSISRNQAHGSPGNLLDLYAAADIPECETYGSSQFEIPGIRREPEDTRTEGPDPLMYRFASSAAHVNGRNLASSETFTWLTDHFKTSYSQCKPEVEQLFLAGINHVFFHGTTYSPADAKWPGWLFYAAMNVVPDNSTWPHLKGMNDYITRCQSVLQAGRGDNDVLIYWPVYDVWSNTKGREMLLTVGGIKQWLKPTDFYKDAKLLLQKGYGVDYVSDNMLQKTVAKGHEVATHAGVTYKTLIVPACKFMPQTTLKQIIELARNGAIVIFQQLPQDVPGLGDVTQQRKQLQQQLSIIKPVGTTNIGKGLIIVNYDIAAVLDDHKIRPERLAETGLQYIRRDVNSDKYYYIVNHTAHDIDQFIPLNVKAASVLIMDPLNGTWGKAAIMNENNATSVHVQFKSGDALILFAGQKAVAAKPWVYLGEKSTETAINGPWTLQFTRGGPVLPKDEQLTHLISFTELPDTNAINFSGTAVYTTTVNMPAKTNGEYVLSLGEVDESAHVWVNGQDAGIVWSELMQCRIGKFLKPGANTLRIEVCNLMANRIRYMDRNHITWRNYHEINFVNIKYQPFDASNWQPMPSGLVGPVKLVQYRN